MLDMDDIDIVELLRKIPEFKPRIIPLVWEIVEKGEIVPQKAGLKSKEITEAIDEVEDNAHVVKELTQCLIKLVRF